MSDDPIARELAGLEGAFTQGEAFRLLPVERLADLRAELRAFRAAEELNPFQRWILSDLYALDLPPAAAGARSVLLVAVPHPPYARVELRWQGRTCRCAALVWSDIDRTERDLRTFFEARGSSLLPAPELPLKRLAARSGLARYGRNNVCYVEGMGSHVSFAAWLTDVPVEPGPWVELRTPDRCTRCRACLDACPTGAIRADRFLIDNERCLSFLNEGADPFPSWLPASVHHTLYDCVRCQQGCPLNAPYAGSVVGPIVFDEDETGQLLAGTPFAECAAPLREKARRLALDRWAAGLARNVRALLEQDEAAARR